MTVKPGRKKTAAAVVKKNTPLSAGTKKSAAGKPRGLVMVLTGNGKGKTTAAFGQALRAVGHGYKVFVLQFMKGRKYGEFIAAEKYLPSLTVRMSGLDSFVMRGNPAAIDIELAQEGLETARKAIASGRYNMVILDEINVALDFKLIRLKDVVDMIKNKPVHLDLILTGRYAPRAIINLADTVSEVREVKHHYNAGIKDRAGIEY
ncbi:MAG TPA: cob(I)yrinic acid a,c-diamide adenosyltransferase [Smithella sp.]|nr:cob(I)yrinic acid a,c-diamide adenosyltransferase [Smithella sp.]HRS97379.1 cob(I)yrinic acid a,c-diamide adenosyltransferase [Smithella sp.]